MAGNLIDPNQFQPQMQMLPPGYSPYGYGNGYGMGGYPGMGMSGYGYRPRDYGFEEYISNKMGSLGPKHNGRYQGGEFAGMNEGQIYEKLRSQYENMGPDDRKQWENRRFSQDVRSPQEMADHGYQTDGSTATAGGGKSGSSGTSGGGGSSNAASMGSINDDVLSSFGSGSSGPRDVGTSPANTPIYHPNVARPVPALRNAPPLVNGDPTDAKRFGPALTSNVNVANADSNAKLVGATGPAAPTPPASVASAPSAPPPSVPTNTAALSPPPAPAVPSVPLRPIATATAGTPDPSFSRENFEDETANGGRYVPGGQATPPIPATPPLASRGTAQASMQPPPGSRPVVADSGYKPQMQLQGTGRGQQLVDPGVFRAKQEDAQMPTLPAMKNTNFQSAPDLSDEEEQKRRRLASNAPASLPTQPSLPRMVGT